MRQSGYGQNTPSPKDIQTALEAIEKKQQPDFPRIDVSTNNPAVNGTGAGMQDGGNGMAGQGAMSTDVIGDYSIQGAALQSPIQTANLDAVLRMQFDNVGMKRKVAYGLQVMKEMWSYVNVGNTGYYGTRTERWWENELWATGNKGGQDFYNMTGVQGNKTFINIDYRIAQIVPTYLNKIVQILMDRDEKPEVKATDIFSIRFKEREKVYAKYRMNQQKKIMAMEQASRLQNLEPGFTPEDEDQLDLYYKTEYRMPEESFLEDGITQVYKNSGYEQLKRQLLIDIAVKNQGMTKKVKAPGTIFGGQSSTLANRQRLRRCVPENTVYNIFRNADGSDVSIIGEAYPLKISDARRMYPKVTEKQWWQISQVSQKGLVQAKPLDWIDTYMYDFNRPYDDYSFMVFDMECKVYDEEWYVTGANSVDKKKGVPRGAGPDKVITQVGRFNIYSGVWVIGTDVMLEWGVLPNQLRAFQNGVDVFSNYSIVYPNANGWYVPSLLERAIPPTRMAIGILLKIEQMISLMEPDGWDIDVAGLRNGVDVGTGGVLKPMQLLRLRLQTGNGFWDSDDDTGVGGQAKQNPWARTTGSGNAAQINILIAAYNFFIGIANQEWGVTPELMAQPTAAKKSAAATNQAVIAGSLSIEYIYDYFIELMEQNAKKIAYTLWDDMVFNGEEYKKMTEEYGEGGAGDGMLIDSSFDINVDMVDKKGAKERLMMLIENALEGGMITPATAYRLENIANPKTAVLYLEKLEKRAKKERMQMAQRQMQMNAQQQQQSTEIATEGKIREIQAQAMAKVAIEMAKSKGGEYKELVKLIGDVTKVSEEKGVPLSPELKAMRDLIFGTAVQEKQQENMGGQQQQQPQQPGNQ